MQEQRRLENILQKTKEQLKDAPQGTLRLSSSKKWTQYYHCKSGEKKNGVYIPKTNKELIHRLAQKSYDEKILKLAEKRFSGGETGDSNRTRRTGAFQIRKNPGRLFLPKWNLLQIRMSIISESFWNSLSWGTADTYIRDGTDCFGYEDDSETCA